MQNNNKFQESVYEILSTVKEKNTIGLLAEKSVHAVIKLYIEPDKSKHEVPVDTYVADICDLPKQRIFEIQTRHFNKLRNKLEHFLKEYYVTVVYPVICEKWIVRMDNDFCVVGKRRKSPKHGIPHNVFPELYKIKPFLKHPNLSLKIILLSATEYTLTQGSSARTQKAVKYDILPEKLIDEIDIKTPDDYLKLLPDGLPETFTSSDVGIALNQKNKSIIQSTVNIMRYMEAIEAVGKQGNSILYKVKI